jgi:tol-pal system protein YbgF
MRRVIALALMAFMAGCASTPPEDDPVQMKLKDLDERLARLERIVTNQSVVVQHQDEVENSVRELRGRVDELENSSQTTRKQQRDLYNDLDKRLQALGGTAGAGGGTQPPAAPPAGSAAPPAPAGSSVEQAVYNQAFDALRAGSYSTAITGFKDFLSTYSGSPLAENAQYWLGQAYYVTRDFDSASIAFRTVLDKWPGSRKSPDAMLKLGDTQYELKKPDSARKTFTEVTQKFPGTDAAKLATDRLSKMPPNAH